MEKLCDPRILEELWILLVEEIMRHEEQLVEA